jgi:hypothetical protein
MERSSWIDVPVTDPHGEVECGPSIVHAHGSQHVSSSNPIPSANPALGEIGV